MKRIGAVFFLLFMLVPVVASAESSAYTQHKRAYQWSASQADKVKQKAIAQKKLQGEIARQRARNLERGPQPPLNIGGRPGSSAVIDMRIPRCSPKNVKFCCNKIACTTNKGFWTGRRCVPSHWMKGKK